MRMRGTIAMLLSVVTQGAVAQTKGTLTIRSAGHDSILSAAQLASIPRRDLRVAGDNSTDSATMSGVSLWDLMQKAGLPAASASGRQRGSMYVRLKGSDGQSAIFGLVEIDPSFSKRTVLVADRRNRQPLDAVEGPWRAFVPDDLRHARWIRGLVLVEVDTLKP
jgi:Oxidoreductase molybdopterin binding domain